MTIKIDNKGGSRLDPHLLPESKGLTGNGIPVYDVAILFGLSWKAETSADMGNPGQRPSGRTVGLNDDESCWYKLGKGEITPEDQGDDG